MNILNLLTVSTGQINVTIQQVDPIKLNWIGNLIRLLIEGVGITALGIVLFTLILKTIVLPLDIYSRYNSKKQALLMEKMRPQMEKLQKQYANDKNMYAMKVQELYKKNGYSLFGACIPMIVSLVIFIVVFNQFSAYSSYANLEVYRGMMEAYNATSVKYVYFEDKEENKDGFLYATYEENGVVKYVTNYEDYTALVAKEKDSDTNIIYYTVDTDRFEAACPDYASLTTTDKDGNEVKYADVCKDGVILDTQVYGNMIASQIRPLAREAAAKYFNDNQASFFWVGNIWFPDSMLEKVVPTAEKFASNMRNYKNTAGETVSSLFKEESYIADYNEVTAALGQEKQTYNGYFVLIVLAIGLMLLQQWITMRSQKSVNELGSVDGSAAKTNKYMMVLMPIMYGIFSFFYSASFSLYMITNTVYSIITTLIINKVMDVRFAKKEKEAVIERYQRTPSNRQ